MKDESRWVRQAKRGDREAFAHLYALVYEELYRYALYALGRREDAEDAVAESVVAAYRQIGQLKRTEAFRGWMFRILANQCNHLLRQRYRERQEETEGEELASEGNVEETTSLRLLMATRLNAEERQIIALHLFAGYKSHEIGELLGLNAATVRSKEHRAFARLREELAE